MLSKESEQSWTDIETRWDLLLPSRACVWHCQKYDPGFFMLCNAILLTSIEALVPTSNDGYKTQLRGVAVMVQSRGPDAFKDGVAHLMFVGVRPLIVSHPSPNMLSPPLAYVRR